MASILQKDNISNYTFHSFRRSSATAAADNGASVQQMQDFYGWKSANMTMEYISTSKSAVQSMASSLYLLEAAGMSAGNIKFDIIHNNINI